MAETNEMGASPATERVMAPVTAAPVIPRQPRHLQLERSGDGSAQYSVRYPQIRGGICEYCGVIDGNYPSEYQYKLCEHYRGQQLRCVYCPATKNPDEVINHAIMNVAEHPDNPNKLVVWCNSYECSKKHTERFKISVS